MGTTESAANRLSDALADYHGLQDQLEGFHPLYDALFNQTLSEVGALIEHSSSDETIRQLRVITAELLTRNEREKRAVVAWKTAPDISPKHSDERLLAMLEGHANKLIGVLNTCIDTTKWIGETYPALLGVHDLSAAPEFAPLAQLLEQLSPIPTRRY